MAANAATGRGRSTPPKPAFYNDPRVRGIIAQVVVLGLVVAAGAFLVNNTLENLARAGIASGWGFLARPAGIPIGQSLIDYAESDSFGRAFVVGFINTIVVAVVGIVLATIIGFAMGIARLSRNWLVARIGTVYVETVRNIPVLLQLLLVYAIVINALPAPPRAAAGAPPESHLLLLTNGGLYLPKPLPQPGFGLVAAISLLVLVAIPLVIRVRNARRVQTGKAFRALPVVLGLLLLIPLTYLVAGRPLGFDLPVVGRFRPSGGMVVQPEFVALTLGLAVYTGAFIAEIVRSGILAVSKGQWEAAGSLGLSRGQTLRLIVIPQAMRVIIPPQTNQYLNLTKNSSLAVAIGYPDFFNVAGTINNQTGQAVEVVAITMAVYLALSLITSAFMNWYNARIALVER
jgi:general L-amino acid transport system permease protein